jgi:hypothetical protein
MYFMALPRTDGFAVRQTGPASSGALGFVDLAHRKTDVHDHVVTDPRLGHERQRDLLRMPPRSTTARSPSQSLDQPGGQG